MERVVAQSAVAPASGEACREVGMQDFEMMKVRMRAAIRFLFHSFMCVVVSGSGQGLFWPGDAGSKERHWFAVRDEGACEAERG